MLKITKKDQNVIYVSNHSNNIMNVIEDILEQDSDYIYNDEVDEVFDVVDEKVEDLLIMNEGIVPGQFIDQFLNVIKDRLNLYYIPYEPHHMSAMQIAVACTVKDNQGNIINYSPVECTEILRTYMTKQPLQNS